MRVKKNFRYSFVSKNRGAFLSLLVALITFVAYKTGFAHPDGLSWVLGFIFVFTLAHVYWDFSIRESFSSFYYESGMLLIEKITVGDIYHLIDLECAEIFPRSDNVYDEDFIRNIMSSGIRLKFKDGRTFLVFAKLRGFREFLAILNENAIHPK